MDGAAGGGHLKVVEFLHENRTEGCTTDAMDTAARFGHLEMAKWLHEHREEGCSTDAMDFAAAGGRLEMIQWLHANRQEGCTRQAMADATQCGHVKIMEFLNVHVGMDFGGNIPSETLECLHWFYENHRDKCDVEDIQDLAEAYERDDILEWLEDVGELQTCRLAS